MSYRGFSLVELLVVLVITGIALALLSVNFALDSPAQLNQESKRLALLLNHAAQEARTSGRAIAWMPERSTFRFYQFNPRHKRWEPVSDESTLHARTLPEDTRIHALEINGKHAGSGSMIILSPSGLNTPFRFNLQNAQARVVISGNLLGQVGLSTVNLPQ